MTIRQPYTLSDTSRRIQKALSEENEEEAWIAIYEFLDDYYMTRKNNLENAGELFEQRPESTGVEEFDAFIGALAEHFCFHSSELRIPDWAKDDTTVLPRFWTPPHNAFDVALVESPAAFRRRGIYIEKSQLARAMESYRGNNNSSNREGRGTPVQNG